MGSRAGEVIGCVDGFGGVGKAEGFEGGEEGGEEVVFGVSGGADDEEGVEGGEDGEVTRGLGDWLGVGRRREGERRVLEDGESGREVAGSLGDEAFQVKNE